VSAWLGAKIVTTVSADGTGISMDSIQCGITKVFLRKPAHDMLEGRRSRKLRAAVGRLQCCVRGYPVRKHYLATLQAAGVIQRMVRGHAARQVVKKLRRKNAELKAAVTIQTQWRCRFLSRRYNKLRRAALCLQCLLRIKVAKARVLSLLTLKRTIRVQRIVRGGLAKIKWRRLRRAIIGEKLADTILMLNCTIHTLQCTTNAPAPSSISLNCFAFHVISLPLQISLNPFPSLAHNPFPIPFPFLSHTLRLSFFFY
jgi:myosin heavy subunit